MAWFSKPKDAAPVTPGRCARCHERPGTVLVRVVAADAPGPEATGRTAWLCDACQAEVRREAGDN